MYHWSENIRLYRGSCLASFWGRGQLLHLLTLSVKCLQILHGGNVPVVRVSGAPASLAAPFIFPLPIIYHLRRWSVYLPEDPVSYFFLLTYLLQQHCRFLQWFTDKFSCPHLSHLLHSQPPLIYVLFSSLLLLFSLLTLSFSLYLFIFSSLYLSNSVSPTEALTFWHFFHFFLLRFSAFRSSLSYFYFHSFHIVVSLKSKMKNENHEDVLILPLFTTVIWPHLYVKEWTTCESGRPTVKLLTSECSE